MYRMEDLPEDVRKILETPCPTCGKKGIHECRYSEDIMMNNLEREAAKPRKKLKPKKIEHKQEASKQREATAPPKAKEGLCKRCGNQEIIVSDFCYSCTQKNREKSEENFSVEKLGDLTVLKYNRLDRQI